MIDCPQCHAPNEDVAAYCDQCGSSLAGAAGAPLPSAAAGRGDAVCPGCGAPFVPGDAFCDNCGAALTNLAPAAQTGAAQPVETFRGPSSPAVPQPQATGDAKLVHSAGQVVRLSGKSTYLIGREDAMSGIYPDVDTSASGGLGEGVGRRHAEIGRQGMQWTITDLNSVNGTWVNDRRLTPNTPQPLNPGDQIRLGKWTATFHL